MVGIGPFDTDVVVDTDVFSFLLDGRQEGKKFEHYVLGKRCYVSFMTLAEVLQGAYNANWTQEQYKALEKYLMEEGYMVLTASYRIIRRWAYIRIFCSKNRGRPIKGEDAWIAACALTYNFSLVTNNIRDFEDIPGLTLLY